MLLIASIDRNIRAKTIESKDAIILYQVFIDEAPIFVKSTKLNHARAQSGWKVIEKID